MTNQEALALLDKILQLPDVVVERTITNLGNLGVQKAEYKVRAVAPYPHVLVKAVAYNTGGTTCLRITGYFEGQSVELNQAIHLFAGWQERRQRAEKEAARAWIETRITP